MGATRASRFVAAGTLGALAFAAVGPLVLLAVTSMGRQWFWPALLPREWSLRAWSYLVAPEAGVLRALVTSLGLAITVAVISVAIALPAARALATLVGRARRFLHFTLLLPVLAPPLAAAMGLHAVFLRLGITDSYLGVGLVHLVPAVPYATLMLAGSVATLDPDVEAQARTLGAGRLDVWRRVLLPMLAPGLVVAAVFAFLISWSQYLLTLIIGGGRVLTVPLLLVSFVRGGDEAVGAALSLVFLTPPILLFAAAGRFLKEFE